MMRKTLLSLPRVSKRILLPQLRRGFKDGRKWASVSEKHKFKGPSSPPKFDGVASGGNNPGSGVTTDDEGDSSPPALVSSTEKVLDDIIEGTTAYREYIRSGGIPENAQWTSHSFIKEPC
jgi:hypothetical protein